jgi:hypothetical protein
VMGEANAHELSGDDIIHMNVLCAFTIAFPLIFLLA